MGEVAIGMDYYLGRQHQHWPSHCTVGRKRKKGKGQKERDTTETDKGQEMAKGEDRPEA